MRARVEEMLDDALWRAVPEMAVAFAKSAAPTVMAILKATNELTGGTIYYLPVEKCAYVYLTAAHDEWATKLGHVGVQILFNTPQPAESGPWVCLEKSASEPMLARTIFGPMASLGGWKKGPTADLFGGPNTLSATIGTGLLGAGLGYGAGWLGETIAGEDNLRKGRLRNTLAILGGAAGAAPAAWAGFRGWFQQPQAQQEVQAEANPLKEGYEELVAKLPTNGYIQLLEKAADEGWLPGVGVGDNMKRMLDPSSYSTSGAFGSGYWEPTIPTDNLNQMIWNDPMTPTQIRAGASGLIEGASALRGGNTWISPSDIANVAVGMGSGYVSGKLVGQALGALAGLQPKAQERLQDAGIWAGFLTNVIPKAFGR